MEKTTKNKISTYQTWKAIMFDPINFYHNLSDKEGYAEANKYFLKVQAISLAIMVFFMGIFIVGMAALMGLGSQINIILIALIVGYPLLLLFSWGMMYVGAGLYHLFVLMFGGKKSYLETFKAVVYSVSPGIFSIIPFLGYAASLYSVILQVMGIKERQQLSWGKSVAVILIPTIIILAIASYFYFTWMASLPPMMDLNATNLTNMSVIN